ncbi:MAG: YfhO family protein [Acidobacteriota bacterium]
MASFKLSLTTSLRHVFFVVFLFSLLFTVFFSSVLFSGYLLAPGGGRLGDGVVYHLAFFQSSKVFWDNLLANGFPMTADPQVMAWYPPALLLSFIPGAWNVFVLSAYVMASCSTYGYVYAITRSRFSSMVAGITYGMCGFMMAHMGHTAMLHSAVWLPLIVCSLEKLRQQFSRLWLVVGCLAVACCMLAGHLQIVVYSLIVSGAYGLFLGWKAPIGRRRFYSVAALLFVFGLGLAALQILPTKELAAVSMRADFTFQDFVSYSFPSKHILLLFFPAAFGGLPRYGTTPYFGEWNLIEMTGYVGLLPLMLAAIGFVTSRRRGVAVFWLVVGLTALLLALGERTPLALLVHQLPVLGQFRAPARHLIEVAFAVSVLAGLGTHAFTQGKVNKRVLWITLSAAAFVMAAGLFILLSNKVHQFAVARGVVDLKMWPWSNPAIGVPLAIFFLATAVLFIWNKNPSSFPRRMLVISILILDLASFGWFFNWHFAAPRKEVINEPPAAARARNLLSGSYQRMLSVRGTLGAPDELIPNLSRLWNVPNATGYGPLVPSRVMYLLSILPDGSIAPSWRNAEDQSLNLTSVRYVLLPKSGTVRDGRGITWLEENLDVWLGSGCDHQQRDSVQFNLSTPFRATTLGIVSRLACSVSIRDGEEVARVLVTDVDGKVETQSLLAGRDSSEWSYDCPNIKPQMQHQRAQVFNSFPAQMYDEPCEGHFYLATLKLDTVRPISRLAIQWSGRSGAIVIEKVSLIHEQTGSAESIGPTSILGSQWRFIEEAGEARIYENARSLPRAWLVPEPINMQPQDVLRTIKTSRFPDGREFDPSKTALVERSLPSHILDAGASAQVVHLSDTIMEVQTSSAAPAFLVTSDVYYPGWQASVNGNPVEIFRTNYALRGVQVPAGRNTVRFEFKPKTFYYGFAISALSLLALAGVITFSRQLGWGPE